MDRVTLTNRFNHPSAGHGIVGMLGSGSQLTGTKVEMSKSSIECKSNLPMITLAIFLFKVIDSVFYQLFQYLNVDICQPLYIEASLRGLVLP
jgi:hypothetical protein